MQVVVTLGEALLVLRAPDGRPLEFADQLEVLLGGAECNVAIGCARLGLPSMWVGKLPDHPIGWNLARRLRAEGVDTSAIRWEQCGRVGIMFAELGVYPRQSRVIYDRQASLGTGLSPEDVDWGILRRARHVHLTGVTAALSESARRTVIRCAQEAKAGGASVSYDVNHRVKLWGADEARAFYAELNPYVDILIMNSDEARDVMGVSGPLEEMAPALFRQWRRPVTVVTLGERGAGALCDGQLHRVPGFVVERVNRFGAGDAFVAGFLWRYLAFGDVEDALRHGAAAAALKMTYGTANHPLFRPEQLTHLVRFGKTQYEPQGIQAHSYSVDR
ncbi:MAG: sugar kinase [Firmicutes bacterium]|nr:sugar kinase [Bacillota bacterium]